MPQSRFDWHERIKAVEREYWAVRIAVDGLSNAAARDPSVLGIGPTPRDLLAADDNLEGTYLIRMFAEFETAIRSYWRAVRPKARTPSEVLLARLGDKLAVPDDVIQAAQEVREYRNQLIHQRDQQVDEVTIRAARRFLSTFLARLPLQWAG